MAVSSWWTTAVRVSPPRRTNEWPVSSSVIRSQAFSSTDTFAWWIAGWEPTKCRASSSPKSSGESMPYFLANAKTVFFCVSVVSTEELSPVRWTSSMSPESATLTVRSLMWWVLPSRVTRTTWVSALP